MVLNKRKKSAIQKLWQDKKFPASFTSTQAFLRALKETKYKNLSYLDVQNALLELPIYVTQLQTKKPKFFRHIDYDTLGRGLQFQMDLGQIEKTADGYTFFLR